LFSPQIPLELQPTGPDRFEDFVAGPNQAAVDALKSLSSQSVGSVFVQGPAVSGKTHLLNALCIEYREQDRPAWYIGLEKMDPEATAGLVGLQGLVCFDGLHSVIGDVRWEEALFHCFNEVREGDGQIVASSQVSLSALNFALPDLASRMAWGVRLNLKPLNQKEKMEVLRLRATKLELDLSPDVEQFLLRRISRDLGSMLKALEVIQRRALAEKRRVTVPLARKVFLTDLDSEQRSPENG